MQVRRALRAVLYVDRRRDWFFLKAYTYADEDSLSYVVVDTGGFKDVSVGGCVRAARATSGLSAAGE